MIDVGTPIDSENLIGWLEPILITEPFDTGSDLGVFKLSK